MNTIYVVVSSGGKYDDAWHRNEIACLTEANALVYIKQAELKYQKSLKDFADFETANIKRGSHLPDVAFINLIAVPKWKVGISEKDITSEMRAERNEINAKNDEIRERYMDNVRTRNEVAKKFRKDFFIARGYSEDDIIMFLDVEDDIEFHYEELKVK